MQLAAALMLTGLVFVLRMTISDLPIITDLVLLQIMRAQFQNSVITGMSKSKKEGCKSGGIS